MGDGVIIERREKASFRMRQVRIFAIKGSDNFWLGINTSLSRMFGGNIRNGT